MTNKQRACELIRNAITEKEKVLNHLEKNPNEAWVKWNAEEIDMTCSEWLDWYRSEIASTKALIEAIQQSNL